MDVLECFTIILDIIIKDIYILYIIYMIKIKYKYITRVYYLLFNIYYILLLSNIFNIYRIILAKMNNNHIISYK